MTGTFGKIWRQCDGSLKRIAYIATIYRERTSYKEFSISGYLISVRISHVISPKNIYWF